MNMTTVNPPTAGQAAICPCGTCQQTGRQDELAADSRARVMEAATSPIARDAGRSAGGPTSDRARRGKEKAFPVLVVDDDPIHQELVAIYLGQVWPFERVMELDFAADGAEALAKLRAKRFALVVLDWNLPVLGEGAVLRQLRQSGMRIPVVVISGLEREEMGVDLEAQAAAFLSKNQMNPETFELAIASALGLLGIQPAAADLKADPILPFPQLFQSDHRNRGRPAA